MPISGVAIKCSAKIYTVNQNIQLININKFYFYHSYTSDQT